MDGLSDLDWTRFGKSRPEQLAYKRTGPTDPDPIRFIGFFLMKSYLSACHVIRDVTEQVAVDWSLTALSQSPRRHLAECYMRSLKTGSRSDG